MEEFSAGAYDETVKIGAGSTLNWDGRERSLDGELELILAGKNFTLIIDGGSGHIYYSDENGDEIRQRIEFPIDDDFTIHKALLFCELIVREIAFPIE